MWWDSLTGLQQVSFVIATTATALMILFIILMLIGMEGADSFDGDIDVDIDFEDIGDAADAYNSEPMSAIGGLRVITIRGALAFFSIGGWVLYMLADQMHVALAFLIAIVSGVVAAFLLALAMRAALNLESSGNLDYRSAVGKNAVVYIRIPKDVTGKGKVILNHQGRMIEVDAISRDHEDLMSKTEVQIIGLEDETTLVVKKKIIKGE